MMEDQTAAPCATSTQTESNTATTKMREPGTNFSGGGFLLQVVVYWTQNGLLDYYIDLEYLRIIASYIHVCLILMIYDDLLVELEFLNDGYNISI